MNISKFWHETQINIQRTIIWEHSDLFRAYFFLLILPLDDDTTEARFTYVTMIKPFQTNKQFIV